MKKFIPICALLLCNCFIWSQKSEKIMNNVLRINTLNPGIELEIPITNKSVMSINPGVGIHGSYLHLEAGNIGSGWTYYTAPFLDLSYKVFYNQDLRISKNKKTKYNTGNYIGFRALTYFKEISTHNVNRIDDTSFEIGPTWGMQRAYGRMHFLFEVGQVYYFDKLGNNGFFPLMIQLNVGLNLKQW